MEWSGNSRYIHDVEGLPNGCGVAVRHDDVCTPGRALPRFDTLQGCLEFDIKIETAPLDVISNMCLGIYQSKYLGKSFPTSHSYYKELGFR